MSKTEAWDDKDEHEQESRMLKAGNKWLSLILIVG